MCTKNDHSVQAAEPGRSLANRDLLRIEAITRPVCSSAAHWTPTRERGTAAGHTGLAVITGTEDHQHAYGA